MATRSWRSLGRRSLPVGGAARTTGAVAVALALVLAPTPAGAHDAPDVTLRRLGERLRADPTDVELRLRRAELLRRSGAFRGALLDLQALRLAVPADLRPLVVLARLFADTRHDLLARRCAQEYFASGGADAGVHWTLGKLHAHAGRAGLALSSYAAAAAGRAHPDVFLEWASLLEGTGARAQAVQVYRRGLDALGDSVVLRLALVNALFALGDFAAALPHVERVLASSRVRAQWLVLRARALRGLGRVDAARADLTAALLESSRAMARRGSASASSAHASAVRLLAELPKEHP